MTTTLLACRWNWCTRTFPDRSALIDHVESDHIAQFAPVKRKDVALLKLVESGASMPESLFSNVLASVTDSSSQALLQPPNYEQRGVMTDPTEPQVPVASGSLDVSGLAQDVETPTMQSPKPLDRDNQPPMKFAELRGTPSPTPSVLPPSPGTGYLVRETKQNTVFPVSPRQVPRASSAQQATPEPSSSTPKARDSKLVTPIAMIVKGDADSDHANSSHTKAAGAEALLSSQETVEAQLMIMDDIDGLHGMDMDALLLPGLNSQWQPQSQLSLQYSLEDSSFPSTINPSQLQAGYPEGK